MLIINKLIKDIEQHVQDDILFGNTMCAFIHHEVEMNSKRIGDEELYFGELLKEPFCLHIFHPWDYISFFSELRDKDLFETEFKENWKKTLETKAIASSLSMITNNYKLSKEQTYVVEKQDSTLAFYIFIPVFEKDVFPVNDEFINKFKKIFEPMGILCNKTKIVTIQNAKSYALEFSFEYKKENDKRYIIKKLVE